MTKYKCPHCKDTGVAIVRLDNTTDCGIQRCDTCKKFENDSAAIAVIKKILGEL